MGHSTLTHQAVATTPSDFTRMLLKWLLLVKNESLPGRFAIKWSLAPVLTRSKFTEKLDFLGLFSVFRWYFHTFFYRFCSSRLHCVLDIPTINSLFFKSNILLKGFTTKNVQKWQFFVTCKLLPRISPPIFTFEVGKCSRRSLNQRLCVVLPLFGFAELEAVV